METGVTHEVVMVNEYPTGAQEWYCPTCGRRFILQWPPNYKRIILDEGDNTVSHSGGTGGVSITGTNVTRSDKDKYLGPFEDFLSTL